MAGRPRTIDRDKLLDAAEALVTRTGAAALSFEAVAKEAGLSKSSVQSCFGTRDRLIRSMIARWADAFEAQVGERSGEDRSPLSMIRSHIEATSQSDETEYSRSAAMMTAVLQRPEEVAATREWYANRLAGLDLSKDVDLDAAIAFLAGEGAFLLRAFALVSLTDGQWQRLFSRALELAGGNPRPAEPGGP